MCGTEGRRLADPWQTLFAAAAALSSPNTPAPPSLLDLVGESSTGESLTYTSQCGPYTSSSSGGGGGGGGGEASLMDASTVLARSQLRARATAHRR